MGVSESNAEEVKASLDVRFLEHYDNFSDFSEDCAFLCDAFSSLFATSEALDNQSLRGLERSAYRLKRKVYELRSELNEIRMAYCTVKN